MNKTRLVRSIKDPQVRRAVQRTIATLEGRTKDLESLVGELADGEATAITDEAVEKKPVLDAPDRDRPEESEPAPEAPKGSPAGVLSKVSAIIDGQIESDSYINWLRAARNPHASADQLLRLAINCANIRNSEGYAVDIATALATNPSVKPVVMSELIESRYYGVWLAVAESRVTDSETLKRCARRCAGINNSSPYAMEIAEALSKHPNSDDDVMYGLLRSVYYAVWSIAARSRASGKRTLVTLARQVANINSSLSWAEDIASGLADNPGSSDDVMWELTNSRYYDVWKVVARAEASHGALRQVADQTSRIRNNESAARRIAEILVSNPNTDSDVMYYIARSDYPMVSRVAQNFIERRA